MELQERQVRKRLAEDFEPFIDMSDYKDHPDESVAKARTSRALAALSVAANAKVPVEEACKSVVDESGDKGIDAIGLAVSRGEVYLVQAKTAKGSPSPTEVMKFVDGIRLLLDWDWNSLGRRTQRRRREIESALENDVKVIAIFTHLGTQGPNDDAKKLSDKLLSDVNASGEILEFRYEGLRDNYENRNIASGLGAPDYELVFERWITMSDYRSEIMGTVSGEQLASMVDSFNERIFDKNIRSVLKATDTNDILDETLRREPSNFWYYNNGITIVANSIVCRRTNPRSSDETFSLQGLSVVNGAQTCGALARVQRDGVSLDDVRITVRVISTANHPDDFDKQVTRYTNTQNQITNREFVALDPYQQELSDMLLAEKIQYSFRTGQSLDKDEYDFAFDLDEATRALACFSGVVNATRAKREIGRMWSDLESAPYLELFPRSRDAATLYNAVRFWRAFNDQLARVALESDAREARIVENSAYMACALLMDAARNESVDFSDIDTDIEAAVSNLQERAEKLLDCAVRLHEDENAGGYPMSFFKNIQKVESLSAKVRQCIATELKASL